MENSSFRAVYSGKVNEEVESIRARYLPREVSRIERLRALDSAVRSAGVIETLSFGILGVLTFGVGMCMGLGVLPGGIVLGVCLGLVGAAVMAPAYPIYRKIQNKKREALSPEILKLSAEIMNESK